jgi:hypothetical protein
LKTLWNILPILVILGALFIANKDLYYNIQAYENQKTVQLRVSHKSHLGGVGLGREEYRIHVYYNGKKKSVKMPEKEWEEIYVNELVDIVVASNGDLYYNRKKTAKTYLVNIIFIVPMIIYIWYLVRKKKKSRTQTFSIESRKA